MSEHQASEHVHPDTAKTVLDTQEVELESMRVQLGEALLERERQSELLEDQEIKLLRLVSEREITNQKLLEHEQASMSREVQLSESQDLHAEALAQLEGRAAGEDVDGKIGRRSGCPLVRQLVDASTLGAEEFALGEKHLQHLQATSQSSLEGHVERDDEVCPACELLREQLATASSQLCESDRVRKEGLEQLEELGSRAAKLIVMEVHHEALQRELSTTIDELGESEFSRREQISALRDELAHHAKEDEAYQRKFDEVSELHAMADATHHQHLEELSDLHDKVSALAQDREHLNMELAQVDAARQDQLDEIRDLNDMVSALQRTRRDADVNVEAAEQSELVAAQSEVCTLEMECQELASRAETMVEDSSARLMSEHASVLQATLVAERNKLTTQLQEQMQSEAQRWMQQLQEQAAQAVAHRDRVIADLKQQLMTHEIRVGETLCVQRDTSDLEAVTTERDSLKQDVSHRDQIIAELKHQLVTTDARFEEALRSQHAAVEEDVDALRLERDQFQQELRTTRQELERVTEAHESLDQQFADLLCTSHGDSSAECQRLGEQLAVSRREVEDLRGDQNAWRQRSKDQSRMEQELLVASRDRDQLAEHVAELTRTLQETEQFVQESHGADLSERTEAAGRESELAKRVEELHAQLSVTTAQSEALDVQHQHARNQLESVLEERESVLRQLDAANQGLAEHVSLAAALRRQLAEKTSSETPAREPSQDDTAARAELEQQLADAMRSVATLRAQAPVDSETLRRQAAQATAERDMLQTAFSTRMAEVQRNLSAVTMEREALKQKLLDVQVVSSEESYEPKVKAPPEPSPTHHLLEEITHMKQCLASAQEEKETLLSHLREHIMELARENYDLKHSVRGTDLKAAQLHAVEPSVDLDPADSALLGYPPDADPPLEADEFQIAAPKSTVGGSSWLSIFLTPFLTDSDMRELHAESYVEENVKLDQVSRS